MQKVFLSMSPLEVLPKTVIIQQGDEEASKFYVLESGTVSYTHLTLPTKA